MEVIEMLKTYAEKLREELLEKCGNVDFESLKGYKELDNRIGDLKDQIVAKLPSDGKAQMDKLADKYTELIVGVTQEFYLAGFAECLKMLSGAMDKK